MMRQRSWAASAQRDAGPTTFGRLLRRYRHECGLTQEQLADHSGISVRAIGDLERGVKHRPRTTTVALLADALGLSDRARATLLASVTPRGGTAGRGQPQDGARLPTVAMHPTYPLPLSGPLVEREDVLGRVLEAFPDGTVRSGEMRDHDRPRLVLITGDAGLGKTRVLAEIARRAQERGLLVLAGGSYEAEGRLPLGALHDALRDYLEAQADDVLQVQLGGVLPDLVRVVPELRDRFPDLPRDHDQAARLEERRPRIFWTLAQVVARISASQPLVLLLDDLQWADETTLQVLHFLTRQPQLDHVLIVGAYRPRETSGDLIPLWPSSSREPCVRHIDLQPLGLPGLATMLGAHLAGVCAPGLAQAVHDRSGGNPFFALEIVGLLRQQGRLEQVRGALGTVWIVKAGTGSDLPAAVRDTVAQRLKGLERDVVEALQLAAVSGRQAAYATLTDLWQSGERALLRALDTAIAAQILEERDTSYAFRHPVLQDVVYRQLSAAHRAWLHARVAQSLEARYGSRADEHASELAYHVVAAGQDGARALHYLTLAADASVRAASWQEALTAYQTALPYAGAERTSADIQERVGGVLTALGRYDEALVALEEATVQYERMGDLQRVGAVTAALVHVHALRGSWDQGRARATWVVGQIERRRPSSSDLWRVLAEIYLAVTYLYDVGLEQRLHEARRAAELARVLGDNGLLARAEMRRSLMLYALRRFPEAQEVIAALMPLAEGVRDSSTLRFAVDILADIHKLAGRFADCLRGRERALAYAEERPAEPHWVMVSLAQLAEARFLVGDWAGARSFYERAVQMSHLYPTPHYAAFALLGLGALNLAEGRWAEATQLIETCLAEARSTHDVHWVRNAERLLAYRDLVRGRPDAAFHRLEHDGDDHTGTLYLRAWANLEVGNMLQAATAVERCLLLATERNNRLDFCEALLVQGRLCSRQGQRADAEHAFADGLSLARSMPYPLAEGRTLYEWGRTLTADGKRQQARAQLEQALQILQRLGARPFVEQTDQALRQLEPRLRTVT